ncbi:MAG: hypothetical protein COA74_02965 [Gammaproteobacteria bacterium]|nr:MAG: hypothetical protein COA74_02965 [Gammaproteobacteria bacterium]
MKLNRFKWVSRLSIVFITVEVKTFEIYRELSTINHKVALYIIGCFVLQANFIEEILYSSNLSKYLVKIII